MLVVDMLDVGQGDSLLIRTADKTVLIDAGIKKAQVASQLRRLGVDHLDLVVATHPHADHIGGMTEVLNAFDIDLYLDSGLPHTTQTYLTLMQAIEAKGITYRTANVGLQLKLGDEATLTVLHPGENHLIGTRSDLNSNSVVLRLDHEDVSFLFTGDAEDPTEQTLIRSNIQHIDVLKVAHHGSGHSTSDAFIRATTPTYALVSCAADNRYGHPAPATMKRLRQAGTQIYRTDLSGHIRVLSDGDTAELLEGTLGQIAGMVDPFNALAPVAPTPTSAPVALAEPLTKKQPRQQKNAARKATREARR